MTELRERAAKLEVEVAPLQEKNRELMTKADQMQAENISPCEECTRRRQRANQFIEKTNRTSPEDWKKLQTERETLAKQLTVKRGNNIQLNNDNNNPRQTIIKLEEQLKSLRAQNTNQADEISRLREQVTSHQNHVSQLSESLEQQTQNNNKLSEENRVLTEDTAVKDVTITELKNILALVKKIANYKTQYEDQVKNIESLEKENEQNQSENTLNVENQSQLLEQERSEHEEKINQIEKSHREEVEQLNQQVSSGQKQIKSLRKEIETLKQASQEKEEKFKTLFKNAKERIVSLSEQNTSLRKELNKQDKSGGSCDQSSEKTSYNSKLLEKINVLQQEKDELIEKLQQDKDAHTSEIEILSQKISHLERKLGQQQGSKAITSSATSEKSSTERPTSDIKPITGHSTNIQTQSVPIQPWRSGGEPPLASIRTMPQQLRKAAVLPTTQTPSAVMVPQVHTTGSSSIEVLSSSLTSSHTDYVPATSSASSGMLGPRQVAVPPTQPSKDDESNRQIQTAPQQQALAVESPRVKPPSSGSGPTQEQGTSSSSLNTVTTTQAGLKRQRDPDTASFPAEENSSKIQQQNKRTRIQVSDLTAGVLMRPGYESYRDYGNVYNPYINTLRTNRNTTSFEMNFEQQPDNQSYYYNMSNWNQYSTTTLMTRMDSSYSNFEERCFTLTKLDISSAEYNLIWNYFEGHYYASLEIYRIQNTALNIQFDLRLEQLRASGEKPEPIFLFHDTKYDNVNSICQNNFDEKKGRRFEFGPGVYFSTRADDAFRRSSYKCDFIRAMFLVDVIVNKTVCAKKCTPNVTSGEYDTLICHRGTTYRKNDKSEYVPRYVAIYWRR